MRSLLISAALVAIAATAAAPAFALNPQPLPPGLRDGGHGGRQFEPPDPCVRAASHFGDGSVHFRAMNEGWEQDHNRR